MMRSELQQKELQAYSLLMGLVICGLAASLVTAQKIIDVGIRFPFCTLVFSIFTYPIIDCICELWGKQVARRSALLGSGCQLFIALLIQLSIWAPGSTAWQHQTEYQFILSTGINVVAANLIAFTSSQLLDIVVYQRIKNFSRGKMLWLRSNISTYLGQVIDSVIFVNIVFYSSPQKWSILMGAITIKIIISFFMTPFVYFIVMSVNRYLDFNTLAFREELSGALN